MSEATARTSPKAAVVGYVEALNGQQALGWVWCPGHADRLKVELWLAGQVVGQGVADQNRDDLVRSGIGDGRHAFALDVPAHASGQLSELRVLAYPLEGPAVTLEPPQAAPLASDTLAPVQRGIETLINSQRLLHRNLQAALLQQGPSPASALAEIAAAQTKLSEAVTTVELFVVRLETALLGREQAAVAEPPRRMLFTAVGISGLAFLISCWAAFRVVAGG